MGSLLAVGLVFVSFFINKEGYSFETSNDVKCFFSSEITDGFVGGVLLLMVLCVNAAKYILGKHGERYRKG